MSNRNLVLMLLLAASLSLVLAGCSFVGSGDASAAQHVETDPATTQLPVATPSPTVGAESIVGIPLPPTPAESTGSDAPPTEIATPEPIAYVDAFITPALDGPGFDITVWLDVSRQGISGVDLVARATAAAVILESTEPGPLLGSEPLVATSSIVSDGSARVAYARAGASERSDQVGIVAVLRVNASTPEAIRAGLLLSLSFTDAGFSTSWPVRRRVRPGRRALVGIGGRREQLVVGIEPSHCLEPVSDTDRPLNPPMASLTCEDLDP
jgi:hypothetical protein